MSRTVRVRAAQLAGAAVMALAFLPLAAAGSAHAADAPAPAATPYADQVEIGTALKIAAPKAADETATASVAASDPADESTATETPTDAVVIETESHQAAATESDTSVAVLGTKVGSDPTLASTGPSHVLVEFALAIALLSVGLVLRNGPELVTATRRMAVRRH